MSITREDVATIVDSLVSHALATGLFEKVNGAEPKSAPPAGLTAAVWAQSLGPLPTRSGLSRTSALMTMNVRLYTSMLAEPQDAIDPMLAGAAADLFSAYTGDFTLTDRVSQIDLLGAYSGGMSSQAGYLDIDKKLYRTITIVVPLVINDAWEQVP